MGVSIRPLTGDPAHAGLLRQIEAVKAQCDLEFLREEIPKAFERTFDGVKRVTTMVKAMKEFAHPDGNDQKAADLNHAITTTLLVASNEYKYRAVVHTVLGDLPEVLCNIGELNQVFLNLIINAAHAIEDSGKAVDSGEIKVTTALDGDMVLIRIADVGFGTEFTLRLAVAGRPARSVRRPAAHQGVVCFAVVPLLGGGGSMGTMGRL